MAAATIRSFSDTGAAAAAAAAPTIRSPPAAPPCRPSDSTRRTSAKAACATTPLGIAVTAQLRYAISCRAAQRILLAVEAARAGEARLGVHRLLEPAVLREPSRRPSGDDFSVDGRARGKTEGEGQCTWLATESGHQHMARNA